MVSSIFVARDKMSRSHLFQFGGALCADFHAVFTTGRESAARLGVDRADDLAFDHGDLLVPHGNIRLGDRRKQRTGIGMKWRVEQFIRFGVLQTLT